MYIENRGQHPRLNKFYLITTLLDISVDQFFFPCNEDGDNNRRKQVDVLLNDMEEKELIVMEATAQGLKKARETAPTEKSATPTQAIALFRLFFYSPHKS